MYKNKETMRFSFHKSIELIKSLENKANKLKNHYRPDTIQYALLDDLLSNIDNSYIDNNFNHTRQQLKFYLDFNHKVIKSGDEVMERLDNIKTNVIDINKHEETRVLNYLRYKGYSILKHGNLYDVQYKSTFTIKTFSELKLIYKLHQKGGTL